MLIPLFSSGSRQTCFSSTQLLFTTSIPSHDYLVFSVQSFNSFFFYVFVVPIQLIFKRNRIGFINPLLGAASLKAVIFTINFYYVGVQRGSITTTTWRSIFLNQVEVVLRDFFAFNS